MIPQRSRFFVHTVGALALLGTLVAPGTVAVVVGQGPPAAPNLVGSWVIAVAPGTPDETFVTLLVHEEGTATLVTEGDSTLGVWTKITGNASFALTFEEVDEEVDEEGKQTEMLVRFQIRATVILVGSDGFSGTATSDTLNLAGTVVLASEGPFDLGGTRMSVVPE